MKILHLYHDIMNLYGEYGNVRAVERILQKSNANPEVVTATLGDSVNFDDFDFIYIGSGTEKNQKIVLYDFKKYTNQLNAYIEAGKVALFTGNSFEMLGKSITDADSNKYDGMGIFDFETVEQNKTRVTSDVIFTADFLDKPLVGFVNKCSEIKGVDAPIFDVKMGIGNCSGDKKEGVMLNHMYGTHLTGPVLIKNPYFLEYIAKILSGNTDNFEVCTDYLNYERAGYEVTLSELTKRMENNSN